MNTTLSFEPACLRKKFFRRISGCMAPLLLLVTLQVQAQVTIPQEYDKLIQKHRDVAAFGAEGFGDRIDLNSGSLEIAQTDVDLPGSNALPVRVTRRFVSGDKFATGLFNLWDLDVPYAHGIFGNGPNNPKGWTVYAARTEDIYKRCSQYAAPLPLFLQSGVFEPDEYWHGNFLHVPGAGDEEMLATDVSHAHVPSDGNNYTIITKSGAAVRCVPLAATSEAGAQGEGFEVVFQDGTVYTLNQMVSYTNEYITKPIDQFLLRRSSVQAGGVVTPQLAVSFGLPRVDVRLYPTKATDRFGNTVIYTWSTVNPKQLLRITASDGRQLTFTYTNGAIDSVTDGARTWTYASTTDTYTVTNPDGGKWVYRLNDLFNFKMSTTSGCGAPTYTGTPPILTGTVQAPTGAVATFTMQPVRMGRSWAWEECVYYNSEPLYAVEPIAFYTLAVIKKTVAGPGMPPTGLSWNYAYGPENMCYVSTCTASSPVTRTVSVTSPDGEVTRYSFGNKMHVNEGLLLKVESGWDGTSALRTVETTYADPSAAPYAGFYDGTPRQRGDTVTSGYKIPQRQVITTQQDRTFTWQVAADCAGIPYCFDAYARPTKVIRSSTP